jgi:hypothetical protein
MTLIAPTTLIAAQSQPTPSAPQRAKPVFEPLQPAKQAAGGIDIRISEVAKTRVEPMTGSEPARRPAGAPPPPGSTLDITV